MRIESSAFKDGYPIPERHTCDGSRTSPPLSFMDIPESARSLVLIMDDIDVPKSSRADGLWNHWLLWNIPPHCKGLGENVQPPGVCGRTTGGETEYQPPCPPEGAHRYVFRLYALDIMLDLKYEKTRRDSLLKAMQGHILAEANLTGRYQRKTEPAPEPKSEAESFSR